MAGVVEVRAGATRRQRRADQHQGVLPQFVRTDGGCEVRKCAPHDQFIRPTHPVGDHTGRVRRITTVGELVLELTGPGRRQEQRHRRAVPREAGDLLARGHRGLAAAEPGQDHRLCHLGNGQFALDGRGSGGEAADPGHDRGGEPECGADLQLLLHRSPQRRVAGVDPGHGKPVTRRPPVDVPDAFER